MNLSLSKRTGVAFWAAACLLSTANAMPAVAQSAPRQAPQQTRLGGAAESIESALAGLVYSALPEVYEKKEDWGATKQIAVGLRTEGNGLKTRIRRRKKSVDHGVWKHYRVQFRDPPDRAMVRVTSFRRLEDGRYRFVLTAAPRLDFWARAKVYQYGIHLIALELVGRAQVQLTVDCEVALRYRTSEGDLGVAVDPRVLQSSLRIEQLQFDRISNAKGPLVRELGDGVRRLIEHELDGPRLTDKLNRAIDKKRDRLEIAASDLARRQWRSLSNFYGGNETVDPTTIRPGD